MIRLSVKLMSREREDLITEFTYNKQGSMILGSESSDESRFVTDDPTIRHLRVNFDSLKR